MIAEIDELVNTLIGEQEPGAAVAIIKDGQLAHGKGYGLANLEWNIPVQPDTVFRLASLTKQFTATAILLLGERYLSVLWSKQRIRSCCTRLMWN